MKPNSPGCKCCDPPLTCETRAATTFSGDSGGGDTVWTTPTNAGAYDFAFAWADLDVAETTEPLIAEDFGFNINPLATIVIVRAIFYRGAKTTGLYPNNITTGSVIDTEVKFWQSGAALTKNYAVTTPTAGGYLWAGGWASNVDIEPSGRTEDDGTSWTASDFDDGNGFKISFAAQGVLGGTHTQPTYPPYIATDGGVAQVDLIQAQICYYV